MFTVPETALISEKGFPIGPKTQKLPVYELRNKSFPIGSLGSKEILSRKEHENRNNEDN